MIYLEDNEIPTAPADDLRQAYADAQTLMRRLKGAFICGHIVRHYDPTVIKELIKLFADMPSRPQSINDALGDALEALAEPYDATTDAKVETAYNMLFRQREFYMLELMRRREPIDAAALSSRFIF